MNTSSGFSFPSNCSTAPSPLFLIESCALQFIWLCYCHTGTWTLSQPIRFLTAIQGYAKILAGHLLLCRQELALSLFVTYLLGRVAIGFKQSIALAGWLVLDTLALGLEIALKGEHSGRHAPLRFLTAGMEGVLTVGVLGYLGHQILSIRGQKKFHWLKKEACLLTWCLIWGILSLLFWIDLASDLPIMVWFMTYSTFFCDSLSSTTQEGRLRSPPHRSAWLGSHASRNDLSTA